MQPKPKLLIDRKPLINNLSFILHVLSIYPIKVTQKNNYGSLLVRIAKRYAKNMQLIDSLRQFYEPRESTGHPYVLHDNCDLTFVCKRKPFTILLEFVRLL